MPSAFPWHLVRREGAEVKVHMPWLPATKAALNWLVVFSHRVDSTINVPLLVSSSLETVLAPGHSTICRVSPHTHLLNNSDYFSPLLLEPPWSRHHNSHGCLQWSHNLFQPVPSQLHSQSILNIAVRVTFLRSKINTTY